MAQQQQEQTQEKTEDNKAQGLVSEAKSEPKKEVAQQEDIAHKYPDEPTEKTSTVKTEEKKDAEFERPEWLPEKFWNKDDGIDVKSLSSSYQSLEKKLGSQNKAPKEYDVSLLKDIPEEDPLKKQYIKWADDNKIRQEAFNELAGSFLEMNKSAQEQDTINIETERKKLGPNADQLINGSVEWAQSLVKKGVWGNDDFEEYKVFAGTAEGLNALNKLRRYYEGPIIPTAPPDVEGMPSEEELQSMVADPKYKTDPGFRKKVENLFDQRYPGTATSTGEII